MTTFQSQQDMLDSTGTIRCYYCRECFVPMRDERACSDCAKFETTAAATDVPQSPFVKRATSHTLPANPVVGNRSL